MSKTLMEYADWLDERDELIWPFPPKIVPVKATPSIKPLPGIQAVTWSIYGTLLRISEGQLLFDHPGALPMQVALDKTIHEFNMWNSMTRKPGPPWQSLHDPYMRALDEYRMAGRQHKGDFPEVDSSGIWRKLLQRLQQKEYTYDEEFYGDLNELSDKMAYFFHANLQGVEAVPHALPALRAVVQSGVHQGLLADAQSFTMMQLLRALKRQGTLPSLADLFSVDCMTLSFQEGVRKPSVSLYRDCVERFKELGIAAERVLHIGSRVRDDLIFAKRAGMRTALYAGDQTSLQATKADMKNSNLKPDRLLTDLTQIRDVLSVG